MDKREAKLRAKLEQANRLADEATRARKKALAAHYNLALVGVWDSLVALAAMDAPDLLYSVLENAQSLAVKQEAVRLLLSVCRDSFYIFLLQSEVATKGPLCEVVAPLLAAQTSVLLDVPYAPTGKELEAIGDYVRSLNAGRGFPQSGKKPHGIHAYTARRLLDVLMELRAGFTPWHPFAEQAKALPPFSKATARQWGQLCLELAKSEPAKKQPPTGLLKFRTGPIHYNERIHFLDTVAAYAP